MKHKGSTFEDYLIEEGILEATNKLALIQLIQLVKLEELKKEKTNE